MYISDNTIKTRRKIADFISKLSDQDDRMNMSEA